MIEPAELGAVALIVKEAVPLCARPLDNVTAHVKRPVPVQPLTELTPLPTVTVFAVTPLGSRSFTVTDVPEVV